jgi:hypothetical protein
MIQFTKSGEGLSTRGTVIAVRCQKENASVVDDVAYKHTTYKNGLVPLR